MRAKTSLISAMALLCVLGGRVAVGADKAPALAGGPREYRTDWPEPSQAALARGPLMSALDHAGLAEGLAGLRFDVHGYAEVGYTHDPNADSGDEIFGRVFDDEHGHHVQLDQIDLAIERRVRRIRGQWDVGGAVEMVYGYDTFRFHSSGLDFYSDCGDHDTGNAANATDHTHPLLQFDLLQAYVDVNVPVGRGLMVRGGKFLTPLGYETIDPSTSPLYSRSYLFGFAKPYTHTGVMANYRFNDAWQAWGGVVRGWDQALEDDNDRVSFIGRVDYSPNPKWEFHFGFITGPESACDCGCPVNNDLYRTVVDLTAGYQVSERLRLGAEALYGYDGSADANENAANWYGAAGYLAYRLDRRVTLNGRLEWFYDGDGTRLQTGEDLTLYSATAGLTITPFPDHSLGSHLRVRPEVRYDHADAPEFDGGTKKDQVTVGLDVLFTF